MNSRKINQILVRTDQPELFRELERALRPFGLQAAEAALYPAAALVDLRGRSSLGSDFKCPVVALVENTLEKRCQALQQGATLAVAESDPSTLGACLAETVLSLELEPDRLLLVHDAESPSVPLSILASVGWNVRRPALDRNV